MWQEAVPCFRISKSWSQKVHWLLSRHWPAITSCEGKWIDNWTFNENLKNMYNNAQYMHNTLCHWHVLWLYQVNRLVKCYSLLNKRMNEYLTRFCMGTVNKVDYRNTRTRVLNARLSEVGGLTRQSENFNYGWCWVDGKFNHSLVRIYLTVNVIEARSTVAYSSW